MESLSEGPDAPDTKIALAILGINFAAIHTSTAVRPSPSGRSDTFLILMKTFTHALYYLCMRPDCQEILREEAKRIIDDEGWTKAAMQKMRKADSFLRECARLKPIALGTPRIPSNQLIS